MIRVSENQRFRCVFLNAIPGLVLSFSFWISGCAGSASGTKPTSVPPNGGAAVTSVSITPSSSSTTAGGTLQFSATVSGTATEETVTWTAAFGKISSSGLYTAPAKAGTDTVTATRNAQSNKFVPAAVTVAGPTPTPTRAPPSSNPSLNVTCSGSN